MTTSEIPGAGGLPRLVLAHPSGASAEIYLHGAHLSSWIPAGSTEAFFVSRAALFAEGTPIRGGVPVVFPQFAELGSLPKHGLVRTLAWTPKERPGPAAVTLQLDESAETLALWPHRFHLEVAVELETEAIVQRLAVRNVGPDAFSFTAALHSYLRVADVRATTVEGLRGVKYRDKVAGNRELVDEAPEVRILGQVDRVYLQAPDAVLVRDHAGARSFRLTRSGFADLVVWNPDREVAASFPDMEEDEYVEMLCVEVAQVGEPIVLGPGSEWVGEQRIQVAGR